jgi:hypothetical protein
MCLLALAVERESLQIALAILAPLEDSISDAFSAMYAKALYFRRCANIY